VAVVRAAFSLATRVAPEALWPLAIDTNRLDRATGIRPTRYTYERLDPADPLSYSRIGHTRHGIFRFRFVEIGEWVEGRSGWGERRFLGSPWFLRVGLRVELAPGRAHGEVFVEPRFAAFWLVAWFVARWVRRSYLAYLGAAQALAPKERPPDLPLVDVARRAVLAHPPAGETFAGPSSRVLRTELSLRARRFTESGVAPAVADKLVELLRTRPDESVRQMRPFELADAWGMVRREVLAACLMAVRAALLELRWQINCPTCQTAAKVVHRLADLQARIHCDECDVAFAADFADHVEATFSPSPAVRRVDDATFCAGTPWVRPHVHSLLQLAPGERRTVAHPPAFPLLVRALRGQRRTRVEEPGEIHIDDQGVHMSPGTTLVLHNDCPRETTVLLERVGWQADIARGSLLLAYPEFLDLFAADAPAAGHELAVGSLCVLFADIVASTELYEELGDARAYALVQAHFRRATAIVAKFRGAVVKTMGDGFMACFPHSDSALDAALELATGSGELGAEHGVIGFAVRVGLHEGPCLIVRANERLDLFGTAVNLASRLQSTAAPGQVSVLAELLDHPAVAGVLSTRGAAVSLAQATLRGLKGSYAVARVGS
jgi:class 3 adenylate cyclase